MPALAPYLPPPDADFDTWSANFSTLITASPATYGLVTGDATAIAAAVLAWHTAYLLAISPATRTPSTVSDKDSQRIMCQATVRPYAQNISLNAGVSPMDKTALGINARTSLPQPISPPTTYPNISIISAITWGHIIRFRDQMASPSVKAKPYGVIQCQIFAATSVTPIIDPTLLPQVGVQTKSPFTQMWPPAALGLRAYYAGRWVTRKGFVGPYGPIVAFTVAA